MSMESAIKDRKPFMIHCGDCKNEWAAAYYPMEAMEFCRIASQMGKNCPRCGSKKIYCGAAGAGGAVSVSIQAMAKDPAHDRA